MNVELLKRARMNLFILVSLLLCANHALAYTGGLSAPATSSGSYRVSWTQNPVPSGALYSSSGYYDKLQLLEKSSTASYYTVVGTYGSSPKYKDFTKGSGSYSYKLAYWSCTPDEGFDICSKVLSSAITVVVNAVPATPGSISSPSGQDKDGGFTVSWSGVSGATSYTLQQQLNSGSWATVYNSSGTSTSRNVGNGLYRYRVRACNTSGCSGYITAASTVTVTKTPGTVGTISLSPGTLSCTSDFTVSWGTATGGNRYEIVQRQRSPGGIWTSWANINSNLSSTSIARNGLTAGLEYQYAIRARYYLNGFYSDWGGYKHSSTINKPVCPPGIPGTPGISPSAPLTNSSYTVSWSASSGTVSSYELQEQFNGGSWSTSQNSSSRSKTYSNRSRGSYCYRVRAHNGGVSSSYSGSRCVTVKYPAPGVPGTPSASSTTPSTTDSYTISWSASSGIVSTYELQEQFNGGTWGTVHNSSSRSKVFDSKSSGGYCYRVRAKNADASSSYSGNRCITVSAALLGVPGAPTLPETGPLTLSWSPASGDVDYYEIQHRINRTWSTSTEIAYDTSYTYSTLPPSAERVCYRVRAGNAETVSEYGPAGCLYRPYVPPSMGLSVPATDHHGDYTVSWTQTYYGNSTGQIELLEKDTLQGDWKVIYQGTGNSVSLVDKQPGTYAYKLQYEVCEGELNQCWYEQSNVQGVLVGHFDAEVSAGDINNDGLLDVYIPATLHNGLSTGMTDMIQQQNYDGSFTLKTNLTATEKSIAMGWSAFGGTITFGDYNIDGIKDVFVNLGDVLFNHDDMIMYASPVAGAPPASYQVVTEEAKEFIEDVAKKIVNPDHFDAKGGATLTENTGTGGYIFHHYNAVLCDFYPFRSTEFINDLYWGSWIDGFPAQSIEEFVELEEVRVMRECILEGARLHYVYATISLPDYKYEGTNWSQLPAGIDEGMSDSADTIISNRAIEAGTLDTETFITPIEEWLGSEVMGGVLHNPGETLDDEVGLSGIELDQYRWNKLEHHVLELATVMGSRHAASEDPNKVYPETPTQEVIELTPEQEALAIAAADTLPMERGGNEWAIILERQGDGSLRYAYPKEGTPIGSPCTLSATLEACIHTHPLLKKPSNLGGNRREQLTAYRAANQRRLLPSEAMYKNKVLFGGDHTPLINHGVPNVVKGWDGSITVLEYNKNSYGYRYREIRGPQN